MAVLIDVEVRLSPPLNRCHQPGFSTGWLLVSVSLAVCFTSVMA
jgi:hypothetical protein